MAASAILNRTTVNYTILNHPTKMRTPIKCDPLQSISWHGVSHSPKVQISSQFILQIKTIPSHSNFDSLRSNKSTWKYDRSKWASSQNSQMSMHVIQFPILDIPDSHLQVDGPCTLPRTWCTTLAFKHVSPTLLGVHLSVNILYTFCVYLRRVRPYTFEHFSPPVNTLSLSVQYIPHLRGLALVNAYLYFLWLLTFRNI